MLDLIIKNALVIDGTGTAPEHEDIAIRADEIIEVGMLKSQAARLVIDARGLVVAPGFIDIQNHADAYWTLFDYPHQESMLLQGITTIVVGQCGASLAPLPSMEAMKSVQKWHSLSGVNFNWRYFEEYLAELERQDLGVNVASLVGHSTMRRGLIGDAVRTMTGPELRVLERLEATALKSGAFGLSLGLVYAHEFQASSEELLRSLGVVRKFDRLVSLHLRSEGSHTLEALDEAIHLAESSGVRMKISHFKLQGQRNWHLFARSLQLLEAAYQKGVRISFDVYPYATSWSVLYTYLPKWSYEGGKEKLLQRLEQPYLRKKILDHMRQRHMDLSRLTIATTSSAPHLIGRSLTSIARDQDTIPEDAILNILLSTESEVVVFDENIAPDQLFDLLKHPLSVIASNGAGFDTSLGSTTRNLVHPRCFGCMPQFLALCRDRKLMPVEKAVEKITGRPARALGLDSRGFIKPRMKADLVIFNPHKIKDRATLENPYQTPLGIRWVIVGGKLAVSDGELTHTSAGRVLRATT